MAYVKHTAIHTTPKAHLKYILNPEKNEEMKYVTGICCGDDLETAYDNFKEIFEKYNNEEFEKMLFFKKQRKKKYPNPLIYTVFRFKRFGRSGTSHRC